MMPPASAPLRPYWPAISLLAVVALCAELPGQGLFSSGAGGNRAVPAASGSAAHRRTPPLKPPSQVPGDPRLAKFDSSTRMLIETELRNATPTERDHWLNMLAEVEADQVSYLLSARRRAAAGRPSPNSTTPPRTATSAGQVASDVRTSGRVTTLGQVPQSSESSDAAATIPYESSVIPVAGSGGGRPGLFQAAEGEAAPLGGLLHRWAPGEANGPSESQASSSSVTGELPSGRSMPQSPLQQMPPHQPTVDGGLLGDSLVPEHPTGGAVSPEAHGSGAAQSPPQRRWIAPLRGRWGEGRSEPEAPVTPPRTTAMASVGQRTESVPSQRGSAYMNVELQRVMTLVRAELEEIEKSGKPANDPHRRRLQIQMRMLHLLADEPEQAVQAIPGLPPEQQEFWIQLLLAMANELDPPNSQTDPDRLQTTVTLLAEAERRLRQASPLTLKNACFCHRINSFGNYDRFVRDVFQPGQPVLIYTEVQNFHSELTAADGYRTRLRTVLQIYPVGPDGQVAPTSVPLDRREFPATEDHCRSVRADYFHSYRLDLPTQIAPGRYALRLGVTDELGQKSTVAEIPFTVQ